MLKDLRFCRFLFNERKRGDSERKYEDYLNGFTKLERLKNKHHSALRMHRGTQRDYRVIGAVPEESFSLLSYALYKTFLAALDGRTKFSHAYLSAYVGASRLLLRSFVRFSFIDRKVSEHSSYEYMDLVFGFPKSAFSYSPTDDICDSFANVWMRTSSPKAGLISVDEYTERSDGIKDVYYENQINRIQAAKSFRINFSAARYLIATCSAILSLSISRVIHAKFLLDTFKALDIIDKFKVRKAYSLLFSYPTGYCQCLHGERHRIIFFSYSVNYFEVPLAWVFGEGGARSRIVTPEVWGVSGNILGNIGPIKRIQEESLKIGVYLKEIPEYHSLPMQLGYVSSRSFDLSTAKGKPVILVFNSRPLEDAVAKKSLLYGHPYLNLDLQIRFIIEIVDTAYDLGYFVVIKNKRVRRLDKFDILVKGLCDVYDNIFIEFEYAKMSDLFSIASASLSFPFGTTKYVGEHFMVPSQFYVPEVARCDGFGRSLIGIAELREWLKLNVNVGI
jgi:hypothetical protein